MTTLTKLIEEREKAFLFNFTTDEDNGDPREWHKTPPLLVEIFNKATSIAIIEKVIEMIEKMKVKKIPAEITELLNDEEQKMFDVEVATNNRTIDKIIKRILHQTLIDLNK